MPAIVDADSEDCGYSGVMSEGSGFAGCPRCAGACHPFRFFENDIESFRRRRAVGDVKTSGGGHRDRVSSAGRLRSSRQTGDVAGIAKVERARCYLDRYQRLIR
jgi:hypothetical protein